MKRLWNKIGWKGDLNTTASKAPVFDDLTEHFVELYNDGKNDLSKIDSLKSDKYIPRLDNPITIEEMEMAAKKMKNGGFDHRIDMFKIIVNVMSPLILLLLNALFYVAYPARLAVSLLIAIPKKGNLMLAKNYRGIQMLRAIAVLFDRVIANRLDSWIGVNDEQSAFQKGKSTIHQLFTLRLLIEIAKKTDTVLYIGMFDLAKAFDKVSRYKLIKKLIAMGISKCMLQVIKRLYMCTICVLNYGKDFSKEFQTYSGIRQGAASSVLLFIAFIDDLVDYLKEHCPEEPILESLHCLLHADDTAILSTKRELFVDKCNHMLDYFGENSLSLNLSKSGYLIINGKNDDIKNDLRLKNGVLEYKSVVTYLGVKISDAGNLKNDIDLYIEGKRSNVTIKFSNFCRRNFLAPIDVKMKVLDTCVSASLIYGCETWGISRVKDVETIYRQGLRTVLSIRTCINNEIVYIESGAWPLEVRIAKQQLNFWLTLQKFLEDHENHYIGKLIAMAENYTYVKFYKNLHHIYNNQRACENMIKNSFKEKYTTKINAAATSDEDSRLGAYVRINPNLEKPTFVNKLEFHRVAISRYRCGSHNLMMEKGRVQLSIKREERLCKCNADIQTVQHVILACTLLNNIREKYRVTDIQSGVMNEQFLMEMEEILKI